MTNKEIYMIWAPYGKKWVGWVRPVPFVAMNYCSKIYAHTNYYIPTVDYLDDRFENAAVIVDLPGTESVMEGLALAKHGYRPVPIYNGTLEQLGAKATVDNQSVSMALIWGAYKLREIEIKDGALPAFLTDSNRMNRFKMNASVFDNSWDVYPQDVPSAEYFLNNNIHKVIVIGEKVSKDLKKILYKFQEKKIEIYLLNRLGIMKKQIISRKYRKED